MKTDSEKLQKQQSEVKARIVSKYFERWANIIEQSTKGEIVYIDLFAGRADMETGKIQRPC